MKKVILSAVAISALAMTGAYADTSSDIQEMKLMMKQMNQRLAKLEQENTRLKSEVKKSKQTKSKKVKTTKHSTQKKLAKAESQDEETVAHVEKFKKATVVKSKVPVLKFSGKHYLGFVSSKQGDDTENYFETRRNYLQVKGYFGEHSKDYFRITLDTYQIDDSYYSFEDADGNAHKWGKDSHGTWDVRLKYAYLYLDDILPYTGVEMGQAHRPWIDYEEHGGWNYRSISKVFVEDGNAAHLTNSADLGINFKTKMEYFSSELGIFNGEGYHGIEDGQGLSGEWRLTGHILGTGKEKRKKANTYADVSFFGQYNQESNKHKNEDLNWYGVHGVYNQAMFMIAAQYVKTDEADIHYAGSGYSVNGEFRMGEVIENMDAFGIIGRYDDWDMDDGIKKKRTIAGFTHQYNKYVEFVLNYLGTDVTDEYKEDAFMVTAEVNW